MLNGVNLDFTANLPPCGASIHRFHQQPEAHKRNENDRSPLQPAEPAGLRLKISEAQSDGQAGDSAPQVPFPTYAGHKADQNEKDDIDQEIPLPSPKQWRSKVLAIEKKPACQSRKDATDRARCPDTYGWFAHHG